MSNWSTTTCRRASLYSHERAKSYIHVPGSWYEHVPCYTSSTPLLCQTITKVVGSSYEYDQKMAALNHSVTGTEYT